MADISLRQAVHLCSAFTAHEGAYPESMRHVCVTPEDVRGTNGHILLVVPIATGVSAPTLIHRDRAYVVGHEVSESEPVLPLLDAAGFPNADKILTETPQKPIAYTVRVNPAYLATIGQAFADMACTMVDLTFHSPTDAIEIHGLRDGQVIARAFLMPIRR